MEMNKALGYQRNNGNRDQETGYRRADIFSKDVGGTACASMVLVCIAPVVVKGFKAIFGTIFGSK